MQLKAQVLCLQTQVTYLLRFRAQTESTDSSSESSSQCGSGTHCLFSVVLLDACTESIKIKKTNTNQQWQKKHMTEISKSSQKQW